jgi:hypothetical protein
MKQRDRIINEIRSRFIDLLYDEKVPADKVILPADNFKGLRFDYGKELGKMKRKLLITSVYVDKKWYWKWDQDLVERLRGRAGMAVDLTKRRIRKKADSKTDFA